MIETGFDKAGGPTATTYTEEMVEAPLDNLFEARSITQARIFPFIIEKYLNYEYELQPWFKPMPKEMFAALERRLGSHMLIVARPLSK